MGESRARQLELFGAPDEPETAAPSRSGRPPRAAKRAAAPAPSVAEPAGLLRGADLHAHLLGFSEFGEATRRVATRPAGHDLEVPTYVNEFWTAKQRAAHSLHEVSYRACFKPQLPAFFIERLTEPGGRVHDPFSGRGTTALEAALRGRVPSACDINPLSRMLLEPRLAPPTLEEIAARLAQIDFNAAVVEPEDELLVFFHPETLRELLSLREHFLAAGDALEPVDAFIRTVAVNRLTGHSPGFFSVYTLPPNQATSVASQRKINRKRAQVPPPRDVPALILRKAKSLLSRLDTVDRERLEAARGRSQILTCSGDATVEIDADSVDLVVTSPPFLDVVQYRSDNWLRCWFCGIDASRVATTQLAKVDDWRVAMTAVLREQERILKPGGHVAFEVGEVRGGRIRLEEVALAAGIDAGLSAELVLINDQQFTKTAQCWGVGNNSKGTNSNRIALFRKLGHHLPRSLPILHPERTRRR